MELNLNSPIPLYHQLQSILRADLEREGWPVGKCLPSENELCQRYNITRPTVRQAIDGLVREGRVVRKRGKGTFVDEPRPPVGILNLQVGTSEAFGKQRLKLSTQVLKLDRTTHCPLLEEGEPKREWIRLERVRQVNRVPAFLERTWVQAEAVPGLEKANLNNKSLFKHLKQQYGLQVLGGLQRIHAVHAGEAIAKLLRFKKRDPLLKLIRIMDLNGWPGGYRVELFIAEGPFVPQERIGMPLSEGHFDGVSTEFLSMAK